MHRWPDISFLERDVVSDIRGGADVDMRLVIVNSPRPTEGCLAIAPAPHLITGKAESSATEVLRLRDAVQWDDFGNLSQSIPDILTGLRISNIVRITVIHDQEVRMESKVREPSSGAGWDNPARSGINRSFRIRPGMIADEQHMGRSVFSVRRASTGKSDHEERF